MDYRCAMYIDMLPRTILEWIASHISLPFIVVVSALYLEFNTSTKCTQDIFR